MPPRLFTSVRYLHLHQQAVTFNTHRKALAIFVTIGIINQWPKFPKQQVHIFVVHLTPIVDVTLAIEQLVNPSVTLSNTSSYWQHISSIH